MPDAPKSVQPPASRATYPLPKLVGSGSWVRPKEGVAGTDSYIHRLNEDERKMLEMVFNETVRGSD